MTRLAAAAVLAACLLLAALGAAADEPLARTFYVSLSAQEDGQEMPADAVMWQRVGSKYYMFLPGAGGLDEARVWFGGDGTVEFGGQTLHSGDRTEGLSAGTTVRLRYLGRSYQLNVMRGSPLGAAFIRTETGSMDKIEQSKDYKEAGELLLLDGGGNTVFDGALEHIKLRGHTSAKFEKKGFTIKLDRKTDLLGMGKAKKWVLTSNARDHALIRNQICYGLAEYVGLRFTPASRPVDLYLNHQYNGTYLLHEKAEIGENRVDIRDLEAETERVNAEPLDTYPLSGSQKSVRGEYKYVDIPNDPADITGGYLVEYESAESRYADAVSAYTTDRGKVINLKEPEYATEAQVAYIARLMQGFENAIFAPDGVDPDTGRHYSEFVDKDSLVLKYMLEEISKNLDGNKSSQFFFKPADSESTVAFAGPAWDYDSTFGDYGRQRDSKGLVNPRGFYHNTVDRLGYWWPQLYAHQDYYDAVCAMWQQRYAPALRVLLGQEEDPAGGLKSIAQYAAEVEQSAAMNFILWPMKQSRENIASTGKTFKANIDYLTNYITERYAFLDSEWGAAE